MTRSASEPTAIVPLRGYRPKSFAGAVDTSCTKRLGEKCLPWTPPVYTRLKRCSMPGPPLGILVKSSLPSSFCSLKQKGQWSVETTCSVSLARPCQSFSCCHFSRSGGVKTYLAASNPGASILSSERYKYCGQVSA